MRKKFTMLLALALCVFTSSAMAQAFYKPGERTTTLEVGKKYFISIATFYNSACTDILYNNNGTLTKSSYTPKELITDNVAYLFTVVKKEENVLYIKNSSEKYLQADNLASTETETGINVVPYHSVKGSISCGSDVQACTEDGTKIEYNDITENTPIVCVYKSTDKGWRYINGSMAPGKSTPFAFYEVTELEAPFELTTDPQNPIYYTIKNSRKNVYAEYNGAGAAISLHTTIATVGNLFYFTQGSTSGTYKIHNAATEKLCAATNSWTTEGIDWYIKSSGNTEFVGFAISKSNELTADGTEAWNNYQNASKQVADYGGNDAGSVWSIEEYTGDLPTLKLSTNSEKHLYYIKNDRTNNYVNYVKGESFKQIQSPALGSYWYFVEADAAKVTTEIPAGFKACYIYNAATNLPVQNHSNGYMSAIDDGTYPAQVYFVGLHEATYWGYVIYPQGSNTGWNDYSGSSVTDYDYNTDGSIWAIIPAGKTEASLKEDLNTAKTNALNIIATCEYADYYTYSDEAIATAKSAIEAQNNSNLTNAVMGMIAIEDAITTLKATERKTAAPVAGEYIQLKNREKNQYMTTMESGDEVHRTSDATDLKTIWLVVEGDNNHVKLQNVANGKYLGQLAQSEKVLMKEEAEAAQFDFSNQTEIYGVFTSIEAGQYTYAHMDGWYDRVVGWEATAESSQWIIAQISPKIYQDLLQDAIDYATEAVGTSVGQLTVDDEAFASAKATAQGLLDANSTDIKALTDAQAGIEAVLEEGTPILPQADKYYIIKSANPSFYEKQGVEMAIYSEDGLLYWKALDGSDKTFYWTITPNNEGKFVFQNLGDNKYIPAIAEDKYTMTTEEANAAKFTLTWLDVNQFNIGGNGTMHMFNHKSGDGTSGRICSWDGGINSSSAWNIVEVEHPDLATSKSALQNKINELQEVIDNANNKIGYYKETLATELEAPVNTAKAVMSGGSTEPSVYQNALTTLNTNIASIEISIVLPSTGNFFRFKHPTEDAYMLSDVYSGNNKRLAMGTSEVSSIFYYGEDGTLLSYDKGQYLPKATQNGNWTCLAVGTEAPAATFAAGTAIGRLGFYMGDDATRAYYSGEKTWVNAGGYIASNAGYDWIVEEVTTLPVTFGGAKAATLYAPVALTIPAGVKAYAGSVSGEYVVLNEVSTTIPANTGVILMAEEAKSYDFAVTTTENTVEDNVLTGTVATINTPADANIYTLQAPENVLKMKRYEGTTLAGFKAYLSMTASPVQAFKLDLGEATGIESILNDANGKMVIYDMNGRRVQQMGKGLYIVNGKKVLVK